MPSLAEAEGLRRGLSRVSAAAQRDLSRLWAPVATANFGPQRRVLDAGWWPLIVRYGAMSALLGGTMAERWLGRPMVQPPDPIQDAVEARMRWAIGTPEPLANLNLILDQLVKQPGRDAVAGTAAAAGAVWARMPDKPGICQFCRSQTGLTTNAADNSTYHGNCDCTPVAAAAADLLPFTPCSP